MPAEFASGALAYAHPGASAWNGTTGWSLAVWLYHDTSGQAYVMNVLDDPATAFYTTVQTQYGVVTCWVAALFSTYVRASSAGAVTTGRWQRVVVTCDNSGDTAGIHIYVDAVEVSAAAGGSGFATATNDSTVWVSGRPSDTNRRFDGRMHKWTLLKRVLTPTEVANDFAGTLDIIETYASDIVRYVPMDGDLNASSSIDDGVAASTNANVTLTTRNPGDIPALASWWDFANGSNTVTSGRMATLFDKTGNAQTLVQSGTSGPATRTSADTDIGVGLVHSCFSKTDNNATGYAETFLQIAAASAGTRNARSLTVVLDVASVITPATDSGSDPSCVINFGDPVSTGANAGCLRISIERGGRIVVIDSAGNERLSDCYFCAGRPRRIYVVCSASNVKVYAGRTLISTLTAMTAASAAGVRVGARNHNSSSTNYAVMDGYNILVYDRPITEDEIDTLETLAEAAYSYVPATRGLPFRCTSTGAGWLATDNITFWKLVGGHEDYADCWFYNSSNAAERIYHLVAVYANEAEHFATFCDALGIGKANRHAFAMLFANDYRSLHDSPDVPAYDPYDTFAEVQTGNQAFVDTTLADYATFTVLQPIVSTNHDAWGDALGTDTEREQFAQAWFAALTGVNKVYRPTAIRPASDDQADLDAVTGGIYYGDEQHMNTTGHKLWGTRSDPGVLGGGLARVLSGSIAKRLFLINND